ncbi:MAG: helicase-related protein, partial [Vicinamibacteria bacterium]
MTHHPLADSRESKAGAFAKPAWTTTSGRGRGRGARGHRQGGIRVVILDEAGERLDMGFAEDLEAILNETPKERQTGSPRSPIGISRIPCGSAATVRWFPRVLPPAERVMKKFRANTADLLIATDVAARGLDVEHVSHVVNYDVTTSAEAYVHRIGRTGRARRDGVAITLAAPREHRLLRNIEFLTKQKIQIAAVPTVADLRARRIEMTKASLRETIVAGDLDHFRAVVDSLAQEFDIMDVAAAAVKMVEARDGVEAEEIPAVTIRPDR